MEMLLVGQLDVLEIDRLEQLRVRFLPLAIDFDYLLLSVVYVLLLELGLDYSLDDCGLQQVVRQQPLALILLQHLFDYPLKLLAIA